MTHKKLSCANCAADVRPVTSNYRYEESGLSNVVLQGIDVVECGSCGHREVMIPHLAKIHRAIALGLVNSPRRLTGPQFRFLRKYLGHSGELLAKHLHTDKTKISKWERGEDAIGPVSDRLMRLLVVALDRELNGSMPAVASHLTEISDESGLGMELHVDAGALTVAYLSLSAA